MTITLRGNKSQALTHDELDGNFTDLNGRVTTIEGAYIKSVNGVTPNSSNALTIDTSNLTEDPSATTSTGTMYFTNARSRAAISVTDSGGDGSLTYSSSTGVITYTGPSAAAVRAHFTGGTGITLSSGDISLDFTEFDTSNVVEDPSATGSTGTQYFTDARADARIAAASIDDLSDVTLGVSQVDGHGLVWNAGAGRIELAELPGAAGGEANRGQNVGGFNQIFQGKAGVTFNFRTIDHGDNITITQNTDDIRISLVSSPEFGNLKINSAANTIENISTNANIILKPNGTGTVDVSSAKITSLATPTSSTDAATKAYVDSATSSTTTVAGDSGSDTFVIGDTLTFNGTANEVNTAVTVGGSGPIVTIGLPNDVTITNNLTVDGNFTVNGTQTTVNVSTLEVSDSLIKLARDNESSDSLDIGFVGHYYDNGAAHAGLFRDASDNKFKMFTGYQAEPTTNAINTADPGFRLATLQLEALEVGNADAPSLTIAGSSISTTDTNQDLTFDTAGTGAIVLLSNTNITGDVTLKAQSDLRFADSDSSNHVGFQAPATVGSNIIWTLPDADAGVSGYALVSNAAGTLSWAAAGATVTQDETTNTNFNLYFASTTSGALTAAKYDTGIHYNPSTGTLTSGVFSGAGTGLTGTAASLSIGGNAATATSATSATSATTATNATNITVADESTDTTCNVVFVTAATGNLPPKTGTNLTFDSQTGALSATSFSGAGTGLTGTAASLSIGGNAATATSATTATTGTNVTVTDNTAEAATLYPTFVDGTSGSQGIEVDSTGLTYNPSTNTLTTGVFSGTATAAQYADLAENYASDQEYEPGTVVVIGGDAEITRASADSEYLAGVISTNPAYLMNSEAEGQPVALAGRVPVRVVGGVNKGQAVFATNHGKASVNGAGPIVGIALETNSDLGEKSVECLLKV